MPGDNLASCAHSLLFNADPFAVLVEMVAMLGVWHFQISVDHWTCYVGATCENGPSIQIIQMKGRPNAFAGEACRLSSQKSALDLPIEIKLWPGDPHRLPDPEKFRPNGLQDFHSVPEVHFGTLGYFSGSPDFNIKESLEIGAQLPPSTFDDILSWLKTPNIEIEWAYVEAFGDALTAIPGFETSWGWQVGDNGGQLLLAKFGLRFASSQK
jgi:hypothetical protein